MVEYARSRAEAEQLGERVQFQTMDALRRATCAPGIGPSCCKSTSVLPRQVG